jgi:hypothetical protein
MTRTRTPYEDTSVPVARSQEAIRKALRAAGAVGVQFDEEWSTDDPTVCRVRFAWELESGQVTTVRLDARTLPADRRISVEQRERQAWRGLAWYLESNLKAATFGLVSFEQIFLAHFEAMGDGTTVGEVLIPRLEAGTLALPRGDE